MGRTPSPLPCLPYSPFSSAPRKNRSIPGSLPKQSPAHCPPQSVPQAPLPWKPTRRTPCPGPAPPAAVPQIRPSPVGGRGDSPILTRETPSSPPRVVSILDTSRTRPGYSTHTMRLSRRSSTGMATPSPASADPAAILAGLARPAAVSSSTRSPRPRANGSARDSFQPHSPITCLQIPGLSKARRPRGANAQGRARGFGVKDHPVLNLV